MLDDRDLLLDRAKWSAERDKLVHKQREALAKRERSALIVLGAQIQQALSQLTLVEERLARVRVLAPFDGVVVSGDLSQMLGSPIEKGKVLFEVAPLTAYRIILQVDERDIGYVVPGQKGTVALAGISLHRAAAGADQDHAGSCGGGRPKHVQNRGEIDRARSPHPARFGGRGKARCRPAFAAVDLDAQPARLVAHGGLEIPAMRETARRRSTGGCTMSQRPFLSASWYRVAELRPQLRAHTSVNRHRYRGKVWHVVQDHVSGRIYRLSPACFIVVGAMDGQRTVNQLWQEACAQIGEEAPSQDDVVRLLSQLGAADLLQTEVAPDAAGLVARETRTRRRQRMQNVLNPLAFRIRLWDPDASSSARSPRCAGLFGRLGAVLWLLVVLPAIVLAVQHRQALGVGISGRILAADNAILLALCYVVLKALHELGHALPSRRWAAQCTRLGVMLLVLVPVPYVDASAASGFRRKWQRVLVGAAGMIVEVFVAALALFVWLAVEDGARPRHGLQRDADRRRLDGALQRQSAAALRRLLHAVRPDRDPQPARSAPIRYWAISCDTLRVRMPEHPTEPMRDRGERLWLLVYRARSRSSTACWSCSRIALFVAAEYLVRRRADRAVGRWLGLLLPLVEGARCRVHGPELRAQRGAAPIAHGTRRLALSLRLSSCSCRCRSTPRRKAWSGCRRARWCGAQPNGFVGATAGRARHDGRQSAAADRAATSPTAGRAMLARAGAGRRDRGALRHRALRRPRAGRGHRDELRHVASASWRALAAADRRAGHRAQPCRRRVCRAAASTTCRAASRAGQVLGYVLDLRDAASSASRCRRTTSNSCAPHAAHVALQARADIPARRSRRSILREVPGGQRRAAEHGAGEAGGGLCRSTRATDRAARRC